MKYRYLNNYKLIYKPEHKSSMTSENWKGWVYEHRYVMEIHLNRELQNKEHVHHLDNDVNNNDISNLIVLSNEDHAKLHRFLEFELLGHKSLFEIECLHCKTMFKSKKETKKFCSKSCSILNSRKCNRPSKEELVNLVWQYPFTTLSKMYNVSDNAIRKWCKNYNITDFPPRGYFLRTENK